MSAPMRDRASTVPARRRDRARPVPAQMHGRAQPIPTPRRDRPRPCRRQPGRGRTPSRQPRPARWRHRRRVLPRHGPPMPPARPPGHAPRHSGHGTRRRPARGRAGPVSGPARAGNWGRRTSSSSHPAGRGRAQPHHHRFAVSCGTRRYDAFTSHGSAHLPIKGANRTTKPSIAPGGGPLDRSDRSN